MRPFADQKIASTARGMLASLLKVAGEIDYVAHFLVVYAAEYAESHEPVIVDYMGITLIVELGMTKQEVIKQFEAQCAARFARPCN